MIAAISIVIGLCVGTAYAYFTSAGNGNGAAASGTAPSVTVIAASGFVASGLIPGHTADLLIEVNNPNTNSVTITSIAQDGPVTVSGGDNCTSDTGSEPAISLGNSGVSIPTQTDLSIVAPSGNAVLVHVPAGAAMSSASANGCQGASFQIPVSVTAQQG
jgi:hypothetical protein